MLDAEFSEDFSVTGTCDALISSTKSSDYMIQSSHIVFELKRPTIKENKMVAISGLSLLFLYK